MDTAAIVGGVVSLVVQGLSLLGQMDGGAAALDAALTRMRETPDGGAISERLLGVIAKHRARLAPDSGDDIASAVTAATLLPPALPVGAERVELRKSLTRALATGLGHDDLLRLRALRDDLERSE